jgi:hypothetical protein
MDIVKPVDVDLLLRTAREVDESRLAGAVARAVRDIDRPGTRRDVEHATAALLAKNRE